MHAYRRSLTEIDSAEAATTPAPRDKDKLEEIVGASQRSYPLPHIPQNLSIDEHSPAMLVLLAQWVMSDGYLRTDEQVFEEMFAQMGYRRRGSRIQEALYRAIKQAKSIQRSDGSRHT